ncbi:uncharacterized protein LOC121384758 [Gigantopelta aegis]|uniref:uncharacterized protein LOC121384758 n=1 Tax=Gigantopelta aegis TaxID=1735272 RepID=UPI001B88D2D6|nr:uncharacterized protein LOC121384758 [Gigantopelta aegis]
MQALTLVGCSLLSVICAVLGKRGVVTTPTTVMTSTACGKDDDVLQTCFVCEQLPFGLGLPPDDCCTDVTAFEICKNCIADPTKCLTDYLALVNGDDPFENDDLNESLDTVKKRFGRLFLGPKPVSRPTVYEIPVTEKRSVVLDLPYGANGNIYKRWGTLNMGSRYGSSNLGTLWKHYNSPHIRKRNAVLGGHYEQNVYDTHASTYPDNSLDKRYGTLNLGKRYGTLNLGKRYGTLNLGKRYGTLNLGKRYGTLHLGKRDGTSDLRKRYGTLHLGKRDSLPNEEKRYGMLYLGKKWGTLGLKKKWGTLGLKKKWGTLGLGNTHHYVPTKRDTASSGSLDHVDKRYGRLFL